MTGTSGTGVSGTTHTATGTFTVTGWDERTVYQIGDETVEMGGMSFPARGFTRAEVSYRFDGAVSGTATESSLISYIGDERAPTMSFVAFEGTLDGHDGTLVLQSAGDHHGMDVTARLDIVAGLGTGGLENARGHAEYRLAGHSDDGYPITFHYRMD